MFLDLNSDKNIIFKSVSFSLCLAKVIKLITQEGDFLCFGSYVPTQGFMDLLKDMDTPEAAQIHSFDAFFEIYHEEYPNGGTFYIPAVPEFIDAVVTYAKEHEAEVPFDHLVGFSRNSPKFSFHDAMSCGDLRLPETTSEEVVMKLEKLIGIEPIYE